ncbi:MAG: ATP-grasp domain-containing protein [Nitrospirae bacterium]|nr:ATP-grasp domain-containing protein [Nitrospirota bacterium]
MKTGHRRVRTVAVTGLNAKPDNPGPGVAVARCLREALGRDVRIVGLGYDAMDPGLYLPRYFDAAFLTPYPSNTEEALISRLADIHAKEKLRALIPCLDAELPSLIRLGPRLTTMGIRTFLPSLDQLRLRDKDRLPELAKIAGVSCPSIRPVNHAGFFHACHKEGWRYPMVVKGIFYDAQVVFGADEGASAFRRIAAEWGLPVLVQRFVEGEEHNLVAIGDGDGAMLGAVTMKKRAVTAKGKAWAGICTHDRALLDAASALVSVLRWRGPLEVEMIRDRRGNYHLVEINPRFPAWIYLTHGVGRNLPAALLHLMMGKPAPSFSEPLAGTMFVRYAEETIVPLSTYESVVIDGNRQNA